MEIESEIFVKNNFTDFEKLLFAQREIKDLKDEISKLKIENGILQSEKDEYEHNMATSKSKAHKKVNELQVELKQTRERLRNYKINYTKVFSELVAIKNKLKS